MPSSRSSAVPGSNSLFRSLGGLLAALVLGAGAGLRAYTFEAHAWPVGTVSSPTQVTMQLQLQDSPAPAIGTLQDGSTSWNQVAIAALTDWNQYVATLKFVGANNSSQSVPTSESASNHDNVFWGSTVYGDSWGSAGADAVGITIIWVETPGGGGATTVVETDVLLNSNVAWNSYRGALQNNVSDIKRVVLHEFGHVLGLNHPDQASPPQSVNAIMNSVTSSTDDLTIDDIGGAEYIYGAPGLVQMATPPVAQSVVPGASASFSVAVTGLGPITYQWLKNGVPISGNASATTSTLTLANVQASDSAGYSVTVTNGSGPVTSTAVMLTIEGSPSFTLAASPATANIATGRTAVFNAVASGTPAPQYQWTLNGSTTIPGATVTNDPILVITGATSADNGTITCTASNTIGSPATSSASLSVAAATTPGYITNLSGRGLVGSGAANALFGGIGISGSGTKQLLIRGMGPSLLPGPPYFFNIADALTSTALTLYDGHSNPIDFNSPWGGTSALMAADSLTGAYAPVSTTSLDSMLYLPVATGGSSASVGGVNGATGDAVIEVYDADPLPLVNKLTNISVRAPVGTGGDILFAGFVIGGTTDETLLIRAVGPGLVAYFGTGVFTTAEVLAQPVLTVFQGSTPTGYANTVWGGDQALVNAMTATGAFPIPTNTLDSVLLITLPPGIYSAEVTGVNNTTGIALVDVYEVY